VQSSDLWQVLVGPFGALAAALVAVKVLWAKTQRLEQARDQEHQARIEDARRTTAELLALYREVTQAIERLEAWSPKQATTIGTTRRL